MSVHKFLLELYVYIPVISCRLILYRYSLKFNNLEVIIYVFFSLTFLKKK